MRHTELRHFRDILAQNKNKSQDTTTQSKFTHFHASRSLNYVYFQSIPCLFLFCVLFFELNLKTSSATSSSPKVFRNILSFMTFTIFRVQFKCCQRIILHYSSAGYGILKLFGLFFGMLRGVIQLSDCLILTKGI